MFFFSYKNNFLCPHSIAPSSFINFIPSHPSLIPFTLKCLTSLSLHAKTVSVYWIFCANVSVYRVFIQKMSHSIESSCKLRFFHTNSLSPTSFFPHSNPFHSTPSHSHPIEVHTNLKFCSYQLRPIAPFSFTSTSYPIHLITFILSHRVSSQLNELNLNFIPIFSSHVN